MQITEGQLLLSGDGTPSLKVQNDNVDFSSSHIKGIGEVQQNLDMAGNKIIKAGVAQQDTDVPNFKQVKDKFVDQATTLNNQTLPDGILNLNDNIIEKVNNPRALPEGAKDVVNLQYLSDNYKDKDTSVSAWAAALADIDMNGQKLQGLADPNTAQNAVTLNYLQTNYNDKNVPLNLLEKAFGHMDFQGHKLTKIANPDADDDAVNVQYADLNYMPIVTKLNNIPKADGVIDANQNKIENLLPAVNGHEAMNLSQADGRFMAKGDSLNQIANNNVTTADVNIGGFKVTHVADADSGADAVSRQYGDLRYMPIIRTLNAIPTAVANVDVGGNQIKGVATPNADTDAANMKYVDDKITALVGGAGQAFDTLQELQTALGSDANFATTVTNALATKLPKAGGNMSGSIDMGSNKITQVQDPSDQKDAANKDYVDVINSIETGLRTAADVALENNKLSRDGTQNMLGDLKMGSKKITLMANGTDATDAATVGQSNAAYMPIGYRLNQIAVANLANASIDINHQNVSNMKNPINPKDGVNLQYLQSNYSDNNVPLNQLQKAVDYMDFQNNKLTKVADGVALDDAMTMSQNPGLNYCFAFNAAPIQSINITDFEHHHIYNADPIQPSVSSVQYNKTTGCFSVQANKNYFVQLQVDVKYTNATNDPTIVKIVKAEDNTLYSTFTTDRAMNVLVDKTTQFQFVLQSTLVQDIKIVYEGSQSNINRYGVHNNIKFTQLI